MQKDIIKHFNRNLLVVGLLYSCIHGSTEMQEEQQAMLNRSPQPVKQYLSLAFAAHQE
jgi:hypothetical protein